MTTQDLISQLEEIVAAFGNIPVIGTLGKGSNKIRLAVIDTEGNEIFPGDPNGVRGRNPPKGVVVVSTAS